MPQPHDWVGHGFKLIMSAQKKWRKLDEQNRLPEIIQGAEFRDGVRQLEADA
jgi:putative transposase